MMIVPGFGFVFCFDGEVIAEARAIAHNIPVMYWHEDRRKVAIALKDGVAKLPFETRDEINAVFNTLEHFGMFSNTASPEDSISPIPKPPGH